MKKTISILLFTNLVCLLYLIISGLPTYMEYVWTFYLPMLVATLGSILFLLFGKNKLFFGVILFIALIGPFFLIVDIFDSYQYNKSLRERQKTLIFESTIEWRDEHCSKSSSTPNEEGQHVFKCNDGSTRFYVQNGTLDSLSRIEY